MRDPFPPLINFQGIEAVPAALLRGRGNGVARALAGAQWLLRRKADGRYLAVVAHGRIGYWLASLACFAGVLLGDLGLYAMGRLLGRRAQDRQVDLLVAGHEVLLQPPAVLLDPRADLVDLRL